MTNESRPLCVVLMPFGAQRDPAGGPDIDFEAVYEQGVRPGIQDAGLEPIRAEEEPREGIIRRAAFERLVLCDFAVVDVTTASLHVLYELGFRGGVRSAATLAIFRAGRGLPFDVHDLSALAYELDEGNRFGPDQVNRLRSAVAGRLAELRAVAGTHAPTDSLLFQLLTDHGAPDVARLKTDVFRDRVRYSNAVKRRLAEARRAGSVDFVTDVERGLGDVDAVETAVLVDVFLSYRAVSAYDKMLALHDRMPVVLQRTVLVREQLAFALNRLRRFDEALSILQALIDERGDSSETFGLMGRIYKDQWIEARTAGDEPAAAGYLDRAIGCYVRGFETDWRDAYPGINAVTLLDIKGEARSLQQRDDLLPVVRFAVARRIGTSTPDYWDLATVLELAVLASDATAAHTALGQALAVVGEPWQAATTANNLSLVRGSRVARGVREGWLDEALTALRSAAASTPASPDP